MGMLKGPAIGGPCDGAKLEAPWRWDGRVERPKKSAKTPTTYHPGYYRWDSDFGAWIWLADKPAKAVTPRHDG